jgi:putative ABC transport system ATP-binding protein
VIELAGLSRAYEVGSTLVHALRDVSLSIGAGEHVAVVGPSGSGKSTLLHILGFLDHPSAGSYRFAGRQVADLAEEELSRLRRHEVGFVFQFFHLLMRLSALGNVEVPMLFAGVDAEERHERARAALRAVGLDRRMDHRPDQLSGGERQRVAIARALAIYPPILLADEPTGNLDTQTGDEILRLIRDVHARLGATVVIVTHDMKVARSCQRTITLLDGRLAGDLRREAPAPLGAAGLRG